MLAGYPDHQPLTINLNNALARLQCLSAAETYKTHVPHMYMATKLPCVTQGNISNTQDKHAEPGSVREVSDPTYGGVVLKLTTVKFWLFPQYSRQALRGHES